MSVTRIPDGLVVIGSVESSLVEPADAPRQPDEGAPPPRWWSGRSSPTRSTVWRRVSESSCWPGSIWPTARCWQRIRGATASARWPAVRHALTGSPKPHRPARRQHHGHRRPTDRRQRPRGDPRHAGPRHQARPQRPGPPL